MNMNVIKTIFAIIVIGLFGTTVIQWQFEKDWTILSRDGDIIAKSKFSVEAERTYINLNTWYRRNVVCPRIIESGGYETKTRCYYPKGTYQPLSRSLINTKITLENFTDKHLVIKSTPHYKYGTRGAYAGKVKEEMIFDETIISEEEFPKSYHINWKPTDLRSYKLIWRLEKLTHNYPDGSYNNCVYTFGNVKVNLLDNCKDLNSVEIWDDKAYFYFKEARGLQDLNLQFVDPTGVTNCQVLSSDNTIYELSNNIANGTESPCLSITGKNITLDCQGYTVDGLGTAAYGIDATQGSDAFQNATIKNCIVQNYTTGGIYVQQNCRNCTVKNNTIKTSANGIISVGSYYSNITKNTISGSTVRGIYTGGYDSRFYNNTITTSAIGIQLSGGGRNLIYNNYIGSGNTVGMDLYFGGGVDNYNNANTIYNNLINGTTSIQQSSTRWNYLNTTNQTGTRIYSSGTQIGGNYYANSAGTGFSETCTCDSGFCNTNYTIAANNIDYLPLTNPTITTTNLYLNKSSQDRFYELGYAVQLFANVTSSGALINETICLDIDSTNYGDDYVCSNGTVEYNWTTESTLDEFNDSSASVVTQINETFYATVNSLSELNHFKLNISGVKNTSFYEWDRNDTLQDGISYTGVTWPSGALEYNITGDNNWTLIMSGDDTDEFSGYYWNGSGWESYASIIHGLGNGKDWATPEYAINLTGNDLTHLITGNSDGTFTGYTWNGTGWDTNTSIIHGLTDVGTQSIPDIHYDIFGNNVWTLISGEGDVNFNGWQWNGTGWDVNNTIKAGLPTSGDSSYWYGAVEAVYNLDNRSSWVLFYIPYSSAHKTAYKWNGTSWYETKDYSIAGYNVSHYVRGMFGYATMGRMCLNEDFPIDGYFGNIVLSGKDGWHSYWTNYRSNIKIDVDNDSVSDVSLPGYLKETYSEIFELNNTRTEELTLGYLNPVIRSMYLPHGKTVSISNITLSGALGDIGDRLVLEIDVARVGTPRGINLDSTGRIQVIGDDGIVFEFDTDGNYYSNFDSTFENAYGIADNTTHYFVTDPTTNKTHLFLVNGSYVKVLFTSINKPYGIDHHSNYLYTHEQTDLDTGSLGAQWQFNRTKRDMDGVIQTYKQYGALTNSNTSVMMSYGTYSGTDYLWHFDLCGTNNIVRCSSSTLTSCTTIFAAYPKHTKLSGMDNDNSTFYISNYEDKVIRKYIMNETYPSDVSIVLRDNTLYTMSGDFNSELEVELDSADITTYMSSTDCTSPSCYGDIYFLSNTAGKITYSDIEVRYDPGILDVTTDAQTYLDANSGEVDLPIEVSADYDGNITLSNLNISYYGDDNVTVTAHFDGTINYSASSDSQIIKIIWSNFDITLPSLIEYIDYLPLTSSSKNVTPFGQTSSIPIMNISSLSTRNADYAIRFDTQPNSCINETLSNTSSKNDGAFLTETITRYLTLTSLQSNGWWMWRDYFSCTAGGTYPDVIYNISACCSDCVSCW